MAERRVVITGLGPVTPIGIGKNEFWKNLVAGKSNYSEIDRFHLYDWDQTRIAAQIKNFNPQDYGIEKKLIDTINKFEVRNAGLALYYGLAAAQLAYEDAGFPNEVKPSDYGVIMGTGVGDVALLSRGEGDFMRESFILPNVLCGAIAQKFQLGGFSTAACAACASGNVAVRLGYNEIINGNSKVMFVGASDAPIDAPHFFGGNKDRRKGLAFSKTKDIQRGMVPFDEERDGMLMSEGAGVLVLEELNHARNRGAHIYAEVASYGECTEFDTNFVRTSVRGYSGAILNSYHRNNMIPKLVPQIFNKNYSNIYINAHGTATRLNDTEESKAIEVVFSKNAAVSSFKGTLGHAQSAASAIELIGCALTLENKIIPATNLKKIAADCEKLDYVTEARKVPELEYVIKNAAGFNGIYSTIILGAYN